MARGVIIAAAVVAAPLVVALAVAVFGDELSGLFLWIAGVFVRLRSLTPQSPQSEALRRQYEAILKKRQRRARLLARLRQR